MTTSTMQDLCANRVDLAADHTNSTALPYAARTGVNSWQMRDPSCELDQMAPTAANAFQRVVHVKGLNVPNQCILQAAAAPSAPRNAASLDLVHF